jgi:hypothetical protein
MARNTNKSIWLTVKDTSQHLSVSDSPIRRSIWGGQLRYTKISSRIRIHHTWIKAFALGYPTKITKRHKQINHDLEEV